jgi:hypothetical protein
MIEKFAWGVKFGNDPNATQPGMLKNLLHNIRRINVPRGECAL